jgi:hypothetical protein
MLSIIIAIKCKVLVVLVRCRESLGQVWLAGSNTQRQLWVSVPVAIFRAVASSAASCGRFASL